MTPVLSFEKGNATTRFHHAAWRQRRRGLLWRARSSSQCTVPQVGYSSVRRFGWLSDQIGGGSKKDLRELGYVEGKNIVVEYRFGEGRMERLPGIRNRVRTKKCLRDRGQWGTSSVRDRAAERHPKIPIVFLSADPIGAGIVTNLSRPGGNLSGVSVMRLVGKWPELAKEVLPGLSPRRVWPHQPEWNPASVTTLRRARHSAEALGILTSARTPSSVAQDLEGSILLR